MADPSEAAEVEAQDSEPPASLLLSFDKRGDRLYRVAPHDARRHGTHRVSRIEELFEELKRNYKTGPSHERLLSPDLTIISV